MKLSALLVCLLAVALAGCESTTAESPLSPSASGPTSGAQIGAPRVLEPKPGTRWLKDSSPLALIVENTTTSGSRPLSYVYEVSTDQAFQALYFSGSVQPGADGRTSATPPDQWATGTTYYWRVRAVDGGNVGPWSAVGHFTVVERVVLGAPQLIGPGNGVMVDLQPRLQLTNAARTGEPDSMRYEFQVGTTPAFDQLVSAGYVDEQPNTTEFLAGPLDAGRTFFWRARGVEGTTTGDWSGVFFFATRPNSTAPSPAPAPSPPPSPGGSSGIPYGGVGRRPGSSEGLAMINAVIADLRRRGISMAGDCGAYEITRRVAWAFRDRGAGLEVKTYGRQCQNRSQDILVFNDGMSIDMLIGAGVDNVPSWQEHPVQDWSSIWAPPANPD